MALWRYEEPPNVLLVNHAANAPDAIVSFFDVSAKKRGWLNVQTIARCADSPSRDIVGQLSVW